MMNVLNNNIVSLYGRIISKLEIEYELFGEKFLNTKLAVLRQSGYVDYIPVIISERICKPGIDYVGKTVLINGQFRSFNKTEGGRRRLILYVFTKECKLTDEIEGHEKNNHIFLDGHICKEPVYRETPLGREITDLLIAVNRSYGKSDYIPCICWGRNAKFADSLETGTHLEVQGRIQSREYFKQLSDGYSERRTAYEVSISKMEVIEGEECKDQVDNAE